MSHGHTQARHYPLGMVWAETELVVERLNRDAATQATLINLAAGAVMSKKGAQHLRKTIKELTGG